MQDLPGAGGVLVAGLGNTLLGDDGFGPAVVRWLLAHWEFPREVSVEDLGTPGLGISTWLAGRRAVVLVDTLSLDAPPGSVHRVEANALGAAGPRTGPHEVDLRTALDALALAGEAPGHLVVVGTVPVSTETGTALSGPVREAIPRAGEMVLAELAALGIRPVPRDPPLPYAADWPGERP